jgi:Protein of unknown function (DUF1573)
MLRYSVVLVAGFWVAGTAGAATWADGLFDELSKDFGSVPRGPMLKHHFRIVNRTNQAVHISLVKVSCGCVTAAAVNTYLKPGEETSILVTMDTTRFTGPKSVTIHVQFDQPKFEEVRLWIQANGRNDFTLSPDTLAFGQVKRGTETAASATVTFYGHKGATITKAASESNYIQPTVTQERRSDFEVVYKVTANLRKDTPVGKWYTDVWLTTNLTALPKIRVPLTVEIESPLTVSPGLLGLGTIKSTDDTQRRVIVRGVKPFKITTVKGGDDIVEVKTASTEAREVHVLTIKLKPTRPGQVDRTLRVVTDLKEDNEIDFKVSALVAE